MSKTSKMSIESQVKKCIEWMKNDEVSEQVMKWIVENNMHQAHKVCQAHISAKCCCTDRKEKFHGNICNECHYYNRKQKRKEKKMKQEEEKLSGESSSEDADLSKCNHCGSLVEVVKKLWHGFVCAACHADACIEWADEIGIPKGDPEKKLWWPVERKKKKAA